VKSRMGHCEQSRSMSIALFVSEIPVTICTSCSVRKHCICRCQWLYGQRHGSSAARFLGLWVLIPPGACMFVFCDCCVLSSGGLCVGLISCPEESYRLWCVWVFARSRNGGPWHGNGSKRHEGGGRYCIFLTCFKTLIEYKICSHK
jgi:hypothetical protein